MEYPEHFKPVVIDGLASIQTWYRSNAIDQEVSLQIVFANWLYVSVSIGSLQEVHYDFKAVNDIDNIFNLNKLCVSFVRVLKHEYVWANNKGVYD